MSVHAQRGFTFVELITAMVVMAVIAAIAVPAFSRLRINSQISAVSGDMTAVLSQARSLAISTRSPVYVIAGPGSSVNDKTEGTDWSAGWRMLRGATLATSTGVSQVTRTGSSSDIGVLVYDGAVGATGAAVGTAITGFAFNNFGQLMTTAGVALTQASVVICTAATNVENGRVLVVSRIGRITNNAVTNPAACGT